MKHNGGNDPTDPRDPGCHNQKDDDLNHLANPSGIELRNLALQDGLLLSQLAMLGLNCCDPNRSKHDVGRFSCGLPRAELPRSPATGRACH